MSDMWIFIYRGIRCIHIVRAILFDLIQFAGNQHFNVVHQAPIRHQSDRNSQPRDPPVPGHFSIGCFCNRNLIISVAGVHLGLLPRQVGRLLRRAKVP
jgi:hypothetical protein